MTSRECVLAALKSERPEWIPTFEWLVDRRVREAVCPAKKSGLVRAMSTGLWIDDDKLDFIEWADWDAVVVYADDHPDNEGKARYIDEWGLTVQRTVEEYPVVVTHRFDSSGDIDSFSPPDPTAEWHFRSLRRANERFAREKAIVFRLRDAYSLPRYLLGMENLMISMVTEPEFVRRVIDISIDYYCTLADKASEIGVDVFWSSDDYCDNRGPVMGRELWRILCLPGLKRLVQHVGMLGKPFIKHCDGNIYPILDDLLEAGVDCIDPIDVAAGVDLGEVKNRIGHRAAIKGGLPVTLLCQGAPDEVQKSVTCCIETAGPEGYILSSSSDITASVKPENYMAMLEAWSEWKKGHLA